MTAVVERMARWIVGVDHPASTAHEPSPGIRRLQRLTDQLTAFASMVRPDAEMPDLIRLALAAGGCEIRGLYHGPECAIAICEVEAGSDMLLHDHDETEVLTTVRGQQVIDLDGQRVVLNPGESLTIPPHLPHRVTWPVASKTIAVTIPASKDFPHARDSRPQWMGRVE